MKGKCYYSTMKTTTIFTFLSRLSMDDHKVLYHVYWDHKTDEYKHDCISNDSFIELMDNLCVDTFANCIRVLKHEPAWIYDFKTHANNFKRFSDVHNSNKESLFMNFCAMCCHMLEVSSNGEVCVVKNRYGKRNLEDCLGDSKLSC